MVNTIRSHIHMVDGTICLILILTVSLQAEIKDMKYSLEVAATMLLHLDGVDSMFTKGTNPHVSLIPFPSSGTTVKFYYSITPR